MNDLWYTVLGGAVSMNSRKYKTNPEILLNQGKEILSSNDESRFHFRVFAVNLVLSGFSASEIAKMAGVSKVAVTSWVKAVDENGFDALRAKGRSGRPSKLTEEQLQEIDSVLQSDPNAYGYKLWNGPSLSTYINSTYKVSLSVRQCQRLFHGLGYSPIRPQPYPSKGNEDTEERNEFKKTV